MEDSWGFDPGSSGSLQVSKDCPDSFLWDSVQLQHNSLRIFNNLWDSEQFFGILQDSLGFLLDFKRLRWIHPEIGSRSLTEIIKIEAVSQSFNNCQQLSWISNFSESILLSQPKRIPTEKEFFFFGRILFAEGSGVRGLGGGGWGCERSVEWAVPVALGVTKQQINSVTRPTALSHVATQWQMTRKVDGNQTNFRRRCGRLRPSQGTHLPLKGQNNVNGQWTAKTSLVMTSSS